MSDLAQANVLTWNGTEWVETLQPAIPDSVLLNFDAANFGSPWPNDVDGQPDMSVNGLSSTTLNDGSDGVSGDGSDDYGTVSLPPEFGGSGLQTFTIEFSVEFSHTNVQVIFANFNSDADQRVMCRTNEDEDNNTDNGNFVFSIRDDSGDMVQLAPSSNPGINDGQVHKITIEVVDAYQNDINIYIDGSSVSTSFGSTGGPSNFTTWDHDMAFWARSTSSDSIDMHFEGSKGIIRWHDEATGEQTI